MAKHFTCLDKKHLDPIFGNKPRMKIINYDPNREEYIKTRSTKYMKRKCSKKRESSKKSRRDFVGGDHQAWTVLVQKLDFQCRMKISQQNHWLASIVEENAQYELEKCWRELRQNKYM